MRCGSWSNTAHRRASAARQAGPDAADVVFGDFADADPAPAGGRRPGRRTARWPWPCSTSTPPTPISARSSEPRARRSSRRSPRPTPGPKRWPISEPRAQRSFTESLALAALFASGDNGQATIRTIKNDGLERVAQLNQTEIRFYQFLPLYDVIHLGNVVSRGYSPTSGEMTWALVDGCFVVADVLSLAAVQPEGAIAAESVRTEVKAAVREGRTIRGPRARRRPRAESAGKAVARHEAVRSRASGAAALGEPVAAGWARWWTVRSAGGMYQVLRQIPEALPRLSLAQLTEMAGPLAAKAGLRLSTWKPVRLLQDGTEVVLRIPPQRGLKYLSAQAIQAGVGVVGFRKMEEHLASRRPRDC